MLNLKDSNSHLLFSCQGKDAIAKPFARNEIGMSNEHKLAAIVFADIAGYTAMMQENEQTALILLNRFKEVLERVSPQYGGRIVQYFGDGCLLAFESTTHSVDCAIALQKEFNLAPEVPVRIGMHQGDVVFQNQNVFGDGVNIASRIESLGIPGAILLSKMIRDQIKNKTEYLIVSLGSFEFKNVAEGMEVFALANAGLVVPKREQMQGKLKSKKNRGILKWSVAVGFAGLAILLWFIIGNANKAGSHVDRSIAVLPFVDMSENKDQEYFSDGLSEDLLNLLTKIPELKVIGRTSSFSFKGRNESVRSIGQKLGVAHLLEGSVRKSGNKLRVTAKLVKASDGTQLWSESYDRNLEDVLKLQDEIARTVVKELKIKLLPATDQVTLTQTNTHIYNLILQGNFFLEKRDKESLEKAMKFYLEALNLDSLNARSWAGVAKCYSLQSTWNWINYTEGYKKAEMAANKVIGLDAENADAYRVLGAVKMNRLDWKGSEADYNRALELEPGYADALRMKGLLYRALGRYDEAINLMLKSIDLDPIKPIAYMNLGLVYYYANRLEESIVYYKKALDINPAFPRTHAFLAKVYLRQGKPELALQEINLETDEVIKTAGLGLSYHFLGHTKDADETLNEFLLRYQTKWPYLLAELYAFRGEKEKAFEWLDKSLENLDPYMLFFKNDPLLKNIEADPRHEAFMKKLKLS